jgi:hypothetical protein
VTAAERPAEARDVTPARRRVGRLQRFVRRPGDRLQVPFLAVRDGPGYGLF